MPRPRKNQQTNDQRAAEGQPKRRGRPQGRKNRTTRAKGRRGRPAGSSRPSQSQTLSNRIDALIRELEALRAEVCELEAQAGRVAQVRSLLGK